MNIYDGKNKRQVLHATSPQSCPYPYYTLAAFPRLNYSIIYNLFHKVYFIEAMETHPH